MENWCKTYRTLTISSDSDWDQLRFDVEMGMIQRRAGERMKMKVKLPELGLVSVKVGGLLGVEDNSCQPFTVTYWVHCMWSEVSQPALSHGSQLLVFVHLPECPKFCFFNLRLIFLQCIFIDVVVFVVLHLNPDVFIESGN